jgi:hypothetical protein
MITDPGSAELSSPLHDSSATARRGEQQRAAARVVAPDERGRGSERRSVAPSDGAQALAERRGRFEAVAVVCLTGGLLLGVAVAHNKGPYAFESGPSDWLSRPSAIHTRLHLIEGLAGPAIGAVIVVSVVFCWVKRALRRVVAYAALAAAVLLWNDYVAKPLVHRTYVGLLTFPSGHVTAVTVPALAMWLALRPVLGRRLVPSRSCSAWGGSL